MSEANDSAPKSVDMIPKSISDHLSSMVRNELVKLSAQKQDEFVEEFNRKGKSTGVGYLLWFFGFHYAYLGRWGMFILFMVTFGGFFVWWFVDVFRVAGMIRDYNKDTATDIFRNMRAMSIA